MSDSIPRPLRSRGNRVRLPRYALAGAAVFLCALHSADSQTNEVPSAGLNTALGTPEPAAAENWNWHVQNTDIVQYHPGFSASYSGPNSLSSASDVRETVSLDLYAGAR